MCGVPDEHCTGGKLVTDQGLGHNKCHSGRVDAYRCMARYLVSVLGYARGGGNTFTPPDGGYTRMLGSPSKYGGLLVWGKGHNRFMPSKHHVGNRGTIV